MKWKKYITKYNKIKYIATKYNKINYIIINVIK